MNAITDPNSITASEIRCCLRGEFKSWSKEDAERMEAAFTATVEALATLREDKGGVKALQTEVLKHFKDEIELDVRTKNPAKRTPTKRGMKVGVIICKVIKYLDESGYLKAALKNPSDAGGGE